MCGCAVCCVRIRHDHESQEVDTIIIVEFVYLVYICVKPLWSSIISLVYILFSYLTICLIVGYLPFILTNPLGKR